MMNDFQRGMQHGRLRDHDEPLRDHDEPLHEPSQERTKHIEVMQNDRRLTQFL